MKYDAPVKNHKYKYIKYIQHEGKARGLYIWVVAYKAL